MDQYHHIYQICFKSIAPSRTLRTTDYNFLMVPRVRLKTAGQRSFHYAAPHLWNHLPNALRRCSSFNMFKSSLKTHLFLYCLFLIVLSYYCIFSCLLHTHIYSMFQCVKHLRTTLLNEVLYKSYIIIIIIRPSSTFLIKFKLSTSFLSGGIFRLYLYVIGL